jgi:hypothetical protein
MEGKAIDARDEAALICVGREEGIMIGGIRPHANPFSSVFRSSGRTYRRKKTRGRGTSGN